MDDAVVGAVGLCRLHHFRVEFAEAAPCPLNPYAQALCRTHGPYRPSRMSHPTQVHAPAWSFGLRFARFERRVFAITSSPLTFPFGSPVWTARLVCLRRLGAQHFRLPLHLAHVDLHVPQLLLEVLHVRHRLEVLHCQRSVPFAKFLWIRS